MLQISFYTQKIKLKERPSVSGSGKGGGHEQNGQELERNELIVKIYTCYIMYRFYQMFSRIYPKMEF